MPYRHVCNPNYCGDGRHAFVVGPYRTNELDEATARDEASQAEWLFAARSAEDGRPVLVEQVVDLLTVDRGAYYRTVVVYYKRAGVA